VSVSSPAGHVPAGAPRAVLLGHVLAPSVPRGPRLAGRHADTPRIRAQATGGGVPLRHQLRVLERQVRALSGSPSCPVTSPCVALSRRSAVLMEQAAKATHRPVSRAAAARALGGAEPGYGARATPIASAQGAGGRRPAGDRGTCAGLSPPAFRLTATARSTSYESLLVAHPFHPLAGGS
jgi:hypothetical protein